MRVIVEASSSRDAEYYAKLISIFLRRATVEKVVETKEQDLPLLSGIIYVSSRSVT